MKKIKSILMIILVTALMLISSSVVFATHCSEPDFDEYYSIDPIQQNS